MHRVLTFTWHGWPRDAGVDTDDTALQHVLAQSLYHLGEKQKALDVYAMLDPTDELVLTNRALTFGFVCESSNQENSKTVA